MRFNGIIVLLVAIFLILFGTYLWKKGNSKEPFWESLYDVIENVFLWNLPVFLTSRTWAVFLWLIGIILLIIFLSAKISNWL
jgi:hypothetical protein